MQTRFSFSTFCACLSFLLLCSSASRADLAPPPAASPTSGTLSDVEKRSITREFKKTIANEEKTFGHLERSEMKQLNAAQSAKQKSWREQEKKARRVFFDQHLNGPERRQYVQDYLKRKEGFEKELREVYTRTKNEWKEKREALKKSHKEREATVKSALDQNQKPDASVWQGLYR